MLEQFYYVGELIGVAVVVISLIFVGKEIHQNTNQLKASAANNWVELQNVMITGMVENREVAELWLKASNDADFESLDEVDQFRATMFEFRALSAWNNLFYLRQQKVLPDAQWNEMIGVMKQLGQRRAFRECWKNNAEVFEMPFREFVGPYLS